MTYKQWFQSMGRRFNATVEDIELILTNQAQLIPDANATVDVRTAKTALCKEITAILPMANVSEGGYSLSWNLEAVKMWYKQTCAELGLPSVLKPKVKARKNLW